jgi:KaiC/GvpD/RAD55 family RecA-like ATPase
MTSTFQETIFYHYILSNQIFLNSAKPEFFTNSNVKELFEIAKEHALKYKEPPSKEQMVQLIAIKGLSEKYTDDMLSGLYNAKLLLGEYDNEWLENNVGPWIQVRNLDNVMRKAIAYMKTTKVTAENSSEVVEKIRHMLSSETAIDFTFDLGSNFFDSASHLQTRLARTSSGYDFIDLCTKGGYWKGSLIVFQGGAKAGKSLFLCNLAAKSVVMGYNTAYVTFELQEELVNMRIGSNLLNVTMDEYEEFTKDQPLVKQKLNTLKQKSLKPLGELHVKEFPSSTASVNDVAAYLIKAQELLGYKFDNIFIDYLNIMKNWRNPNTENTYMKIKQISEDVRAMGQQNDWACVSVTQVNREGLNSTDSTITSVAESAGLLHTVDLLFGLISEPVMKAKGECYIKCLLNRVGGYENNKKRYLVNWKYARIEEDKMSPIQDMEFFINNVAAGHKYPRSQKPTTATIDAVISNSVKSADPIPDNISVKNANINKISGESLF